jgi:N-acyl-L-homoserine lactone synthetase
LRPRPLIIEGVGEVIVVVESSNAHQHANLLEKMFQQRARFFHDRLKWDVRVVDGQERDRYDDESPVYLIYTDDLGREVKGSLRLLPTTGPTLATDVFSDTLPDAVHLSAPTIWECSRFCLDDKVLAGGIEAITFTSRVLIAALGNVAMRAGIESIIGNFDASKLRLYQRIGCEVDILGSTSRYGDPVYLGLHPISEKIVQRVWAKLRDDRLAAAVAREIAVKPSNLPAQQLVSRDLPDELPDALELPLQRTASRPQQTSQNNPSSAA